VNISRYLRPARAASIAKTLKQGVGEVRVEAETETGYDLRCVRVPDDQISQAFAARIAKLPSSLQWKPAEPSHRRRGWQAIRRLFAGRSPAFDPERITYMVQVGDSAEDLGDMLSEVIEAASRFPSAFEPRLALAKLLQALGGSELGEQSRLDAARIALDESLVLGGGHSTYLEFAELCLEEGEPEEAEAWNQLAKKRGLEPARSAYLDCEIAFQRGDLKSLTTGVSHYRHAETDPDPNFVRAAMMLFAAGEKAKAVRALDWALREGSLEEGQWVLAAALKIAMEGFDAASLRELASVSGIDEDTVKKLASRMSAELKELRAEWRSILKRKRTRHSASEDGASRTRDNEDGLP
jgi:hypothetical protein